MSARTKARKRALDILFAAEARRESALDLLQTQVEAGELNNPYTATLVRGVVAEQPHIDEIVAKYAEGWSLDRMPAVDRNVLRIAIWELLYAAAAGDEIPTGVAVSEAVHLVQDLSTDESPAYVNGVLGAIERDRATLA